MSYSNLFKQHLHPFNAVAAEIAWKVIYHFPSVEGALDFSGMNETDVREEIVRPLLHRLGFQRGSKANIRTEVTLRYDRAFLGRKKLRKDPPLVGRADYICEAISYGRWIVEVKSPEQEISRDDIEQAHTYCAHPEISGSHMLLTNGKQFQLFPVGQLDRPILNWSYGQIDDFILPLLNIVGYDAIVRRSRSNNVDFADTLGPGLPSRVEIVGGEVIYGEHQADHPIFNNNPVVGKTAPVTGKEVTRSEDGRLKAVVTLISPFQDLAELNRVAGIGDFVFLCADKFISTDPENPNIFQNVVEAEIPPGVSIDISIPRMTIQLPVGFKCLTFSEATGYIDGDFFIGQIRFSYDYEIIPSNNPLNPQMAMIAGMLPKQAHIEGVGDFKIRVLR